MMDALPSLGILGQEKVDSPYRQETRGKPGVKAKLFTGKSKAMTFLR